MTGLEALIVPALVQAGTSVGTAITVANVAGAVGTVASIGGTVLGAAGAVSSGLSARAQAQSQSQAAQYNAQVARNNAAQAADAARRDASDIRADIDRRISSQRAIRAGAGVSVGQGSSLLAELDQAAEGAIAAERRLFQGGLEQQGFEQQSQLRETEAQAATQAGRSAFTGSILRAGSILTGVA